MLILTLVQDMIVQVSGGRPLNLIRIRFCRVASDNTYHTCSSASFSTNGTSYQRVCGRELEDTRRDIIRHFMELAIVEQLIETMLLGYQSLTVVIHVSTFGLLLVALLKLLELLVIALVLLLEE